MKIVIDATSIVNYPTGAGNYSLKLLENLLKIDTKNNYKIIVQKKLNSHHPVFNLKFQFLKANIPTIGPKRELIYPIFFKKNKISCDIFHWLTPYLPLFQDFPSIITVHDLTYIKYPHFFGNRLKSLYFKKIMKRACQRASKLIAISKNTKRDLEQILKMDPLKIKVIYEDAYLEKPKVPAKILQNLKKPYILYVGEKRPHKNLEGLIRAFSLFKKNDKWDTCLVLVGKKYQDYSSYLFLIKELGLEKNIILMEKVSDKELISLYSHADIFILISFSEGFGLPVLEAMKFDVPIIISNIGALTEIAKDAALVVNPANFEEIAKAIFELFNSKELKNELVEKGFLRSRDFSWKKTAQETLNLYEEVYQQTKNNSF